MKKRDFGWPCPRCSFIIYDVGHHFKFDNATTFKITYRNTDGKVIAAPTSFHFRARRHLLQQPMRRRRLMLFIPSR